MPRKYWIAAGAAVALVGLWLYSRRAQNPTAAPTTLAVGLVGITPIIDDISGGELSGSATKAIV